MLTRLKVTGFKNLVDVDVHFGPFTCIAGANGVGKSNLFDAIRFLSALADRTFVDAAKSVRDESGRATDIRALFHRVGEKITDRMRFEAEMIIPPEGVDDLGQPVNASATFLNYTVELGYRQSSGNSGESLELRHESLTHIPHGEFRQRLRFPQELSWLESVAPRSRIGRHTGLPFISTGKDAGTGQQIVTQHSEELSGIDNSRISVAHLMPRTALSTANLSFIPTAVLARREMQSWRLLHLDPAALRRPDTFGGPSRLGPDGSHLPSTLYRLSQTVPERGPMACDMVAGRLGELISDIRTVRVDRDEGRELLSLIATDRHKTPLSARALSDGTLRFLALAVLELDPQEGGVICFEEPENGIHPLRIPAMLRLLKHIAVDAMWPVAPDNPLRQVIVNTHSPLVVAEVAEDDLLAAVSQQAIQDGVRFQRVVFQCMKGTWRTKVIPAPQTVALGELAAYVGGQFAGDEPESVNGHVPVRRVRDRADVRDLYGPPADSA